MNCCELCGTQSNKFLCRKCSNIIYVGSWNNWVKSTPIKKKKKVIKFTRFEEVKYK